MSTNRDLPNVIDSRTAFEGKVFDVSVDTIKEGDLVYQREVVRHPGSAVIVPVFADETVALVRQYRHPAVKYLLDLPAGTLNDRERPEDGAAREFEDEVIEVVRISFSESLEMISAGEIEDAKTIIGLMLAAPRIGSPMLEAVYRAVCRVSDLRFKISDWLVV